MTRLLLSSFLGLVMGCEAGEPEEVSDIEVVGSDGVPIVYWSGGMAELVTITDSEGVYLWSIAPDMQEALCANDLDGDEGVVWGELPEGYASTDVVGQPLEPPAFLADGVYSVGVGVCTHADDLMVQYANNGVGFGVVEGDIQMFRD